MDRPEVNETAEVDVVVIEGSLDSRESNQQLVLTKDNSELMPFTVYKAKQLDDLAALNATDFNDALQRVTGIQIRQRPSHVRGNSQ